VNGCGIAENFAWYEVSGQVLDADTNEPIRLAEVSFRLRRNGLLFARNNAITTQANELGGFREAILVDHDAAPCGLLGCAPLRPSELGDPPDEVEVTVRTSDRIGITVVSVNSDEIVLEEPNYGLIELGEFAIRLQAIE